ncbi:hypothetical protein DFH09DRAFT_967261 [Mycena vulgaris]|nr:hypothetical protein DFH09DRAFT_967261 [Mycena vulgaris]
MDGDYEQNPGTGASPLTQSTEVWFDDGTVVLQAEATLFRVYRGVLAAQSSIFSDMFAIPQPPTQETYAGCPLVLLHDSPEDLKLFLMVLHDAGYFVKCPVNDFTALSALFRLSVKYDVDHIRTRMISLLTTIYPASLDAWRARTLPPGYHEISEDDFLALDLASTHHILPILPGIYYECCRYPLNELLDPRAAISMSDKVKCVLAIEKYIEKWSRRIHYSLFHPDETACQDPECDVARLAWIGGNGMPKFEEIFSTDFDWKVVGLCEGCVRMGTTTFDAEREELWDDLPSLFGLRPWEELLKPS